MIESSRTRVSVVVASPVSLDAGWVSTLHTLMSNGALAATTKDPIASIAKGICDTIHALAELRDPLGNKILRRLDRPVA